MRPSVGVWIWTLALCDGGVPSALVNRCKTYGIGHVLIKTNDGRMPYNGSLMHIVDAFQAAKVNVWSWQYTYGKFPEEEAKAFADRSLMLGVNGLCVDAEIEYKGQPARAAKYMAALRKAVAGTRPIAVSSYYLPKNHPDFPWREFYSAAEYAMPQVYWYKNDSAKALRKSLEQHGPYRLNALPSSWVIPAGTITPEHHSTPKSIAAFLKEAEKQGLGMVNMWSWQHATPALWEAIRKPE